MRSLKIIYLIDVSPGKDSAAADLFSHLDINYSASDFISRRFPLDLSSVSGVNICVL